MACCSGALKRITGIDLLQDLSDFFQSFGDMAQGFSERAQRVKELLGQRGTTFLLVTAPQRDAIDEGVFFWRRLKEARLPFGGVVVNKVHRDFVAVNGAGGQHRATDPVEDDLLAELERFLDGYRDLAGRVYENFERYQALAARDRENLAALTSASTMTASCACRTSTRTCTTSTASHRSTPTCSDPRPSAARFSRSPASELHDR